MKYYIFVSFSLFFFSSGLYQFHLLQKNTVNDSLEQIQLDTPAYFIAGEISRENGNNYDLNKVIQISKKHGIEYAKHRAFLYPPLFGKFISILHFKDIYVLQTYLAHLKIITILFFSLFFPYWLFYLQGSHHPSRAILFFLMSGILFWSFSYMSPVISDLEDGQVNLLILLILFLGLLVIESAESLSAFTAVIGLFIKISPGILFLHYAIYRKKIAVLSFLALSLSAILLSLILLGWDINAIYFKQIFWPFATGNTIPLLEWPLSHNLNQSFKGLFSRLFLDEYSDRYTQTVPLIRSEIIFTSVSFITNISLLVYTLYAIHNGRKYSKTKYLSYLGYSALIALMPLISPLTWHHHLVILMIPFGFLIFEFLNTKDYLSGFYALAVFVLFYFKPLHMYPNFYEYSFLHYLKLTGNLLLFIGSLRILKNYSVKIAASNG